MNIAKKPTNGSYEKEDSPLCLLCPVLRNYNLFIYPIPMKTEKQLLEIVEELIQQTVNGDMTHTQKVNVTTILFVLKKDISEAFKLIRKIKKS